MDKIKSAKLVIRCGACYHTETIDYRFAPQQIGLAMEHRCKGCKRPMHVHSNRDDHPESLWQTTTKSLIMGKWVASNEWSTHIPRTNEV